MKKPKPLNFLIVAPLFVGLLYWYTSQIQSRTDNNPDRSIVKKTLTFDKISRDIFISTSANRLTNKKVPLIIFLHGMDGAWPSRRFTKPQYDFINKMAWKYNFIAAFPKGSNESCSDPKKDPKREFLFYNCWSTSDEKDLSFIKKLRQALVNQYGIDANNCYLIGFSNGGYFVSDYMIKKQSNDFAGFGIHAGGGEINKDDTINKNVGKFLISLNVGKKDEFQFNDMRDLKKELLNIGWQENKNLKYQEYEARHEMSKTAFENEIKFFLKKD
ncbi:MAG: hypothetical protein H7263_03520 [Candidatus Sericytochromatia bacterium]|nr:hypothetical protein [Candidatus Sericytochromatia bacterium]